MMHKLSQKMEQLTHPLGDRMRVFIAVLPAVLIISITLATFLYLNERETEHAAQELKIITGHYAELLDRRMQVAQTILNTTAGFYAGSVEVSRAEFREFVSSASLPKHSIQAISWVPRVPDSERIAYETRARQDGLDGFIVYEKDITGRHVPVSIREEYFPVFFTEPLQHNEAALGFDLNSNTVRRAALERARDSGKLAVTAPIHLVLEDDDQSGFLIIQPVYAKGISASTPVERRLHLTGFVVIVFRAGDLVEKALMRIAQQDVDMRLVDAAVVQGQNLLYEDASFSTTLQNPGSAAMRQVITLNVPGRTWRMDIVPTLEFFTVRQSLAGQIVLASGLLIATLVQVLMLALSSRSAHIEKLVTERTEALRNSNLLLKTISRAEGQFIRDADVREVFDNLLADILSFTGSEYGFIGEVLHTSEGEPYLKTFAITNIAWNAETRAFYEQNAPQGMEFRNMKTLFGVAITSGNAVFANDPVNDPRRGGLPPGHPALNAFLGIPLKQDNKVIGMFGIANRAGGYDQALLDSLEPLVVTCTRLVNAIKNNRNRQAAETRFRQLLEAAPEAMVVVNREGRIVHVNAQVGKIFEYAHQELLHQHIEILIPERFRARHSEYINHYFADPTPRPMSDRPDLYGLRKDGTEFPVEINLSPLENDEGTLVIAAIRDVTQRQRAEEERLRLQHQLQQAQKMEAIGQLTGGIAHDFNNILTSILGFSDLAITHFATDQNSKPYQYLREIQIAGERARDLVAKMLTFSRGAKTEVKPVQLSPLVKEVVQTLRSILPASIDLTCRIGENVPSVLVDEVQLHQVIMNLCINARDALEGQGNIEISLHHRRNLRFVCDSCHRNLEGDFVELVVSDNGQGIPEEVLPRIFEPFFSTKQVGKGTGMGLSMVHGIVHEHGGHIRVTSVQEQGSTFRVLLPVATEEMKESSVAPTPVPQHKIVSGRILIVDDETALTRFFTEYLEEHGYTVKAFNDPVEALVYFQANLDAVDLVLTDQTMPGMTGSEMVQEMFALRRDLPVILATGYSEQIDEQKAKQLNIRAFLPKPVKANQLLALIGEILGTKM